ncbi:MAG: NADH-quinone oxidoreductase subunit A [Candidatus Hydrothermarchaeaceae archaeon]
MRYDLFLEGYLLVAIVALVGILFTILVMQVGGLFRPSAPTPAKYETYECGEITIGTTRITVGVQYYLYALLFLIFDVETMFLFPWAMSLGELGFLSFIEMMLFIGVIAFGLGYAWKTGALEWGQ